MHQKKTMLPSPVSCGFCWSLGVGGWSGRGCTDKAGISQASCCSQTHQSCQGYGGNKTCWCLFRSPGGMSLWWPAEDGKQTQPKTDALGLVGELPHVIYISTFSEISWIFFLRRLWCRGRALIRISQGQDTEPHICPYGHRLAPVGVHQWSCHGCVNVCVGWVNGTVTARHFKSKVEQPYISIQNMPFTIFSI